MKITYEQAIKIASEHIELGQIPVEDRLDGNKMILRDEDTIEKVYGWYFCPVPSMLLKTGDEKYVMIGNLPFLVKKDGGEIVEFGSAYSIEQNIKLYEEQMKRIAESKYKNRSK